MSVVPSLLAESILICSKKEVELVQNMFEQERTKPIESCFFETESHASIKRALLEIITSGKANSGEQIDRYIQSTFFYTCLSLKKSPIDERTMVDKALEWLCDNELIHRTEKENVLEDAEVRFEPTPLAFAVINSSINPEDGLKLVVELNKAQRNLCLENDLHLIYLVQHSSRTVRPRSLIHCRSFLPI